MSRMESSDVCVTCGHDGGEHQAGECWAEVYNDPHDPGHQCECGWYEPVERRP